MKAKTTTERIKSWNEQYPIGTPVEYVAPTAGDRRRGRTRSKAVDRDGLACVLVEGCSEPVQLGNVRVLELGSEDAAIVDQMAAAAKDAIHAEWSARLELDTLSAFVLLGALQLVLRHPLINEEAGGILRGLAVHLQQSLPPELGEMADLGWDPQFDARVESVQTPLWDGQHGAIGSRVGGSIDA